MTGANNVIEVSEADFETAVIEQSSKIPVAVDFWAPWCRPCRVLGPILEKLADEAGGSFILAKLNVDENAQIAVQYEVRGIPTVKVFRDGRVVAEFTGAQPEQKVREFIKKAAPNFFDKRLYDGNFFLSIRLWKSAEKTFRELKGLAPRHPSVGIGLAKSLLPQGRGCEALELLEEFPRSDDVLQAENLKALAEMLCEVESGDPPIEENEQDAVYYQAARLLARGNFAAGMDGLLDLLRRDKRYRKGRPKQVMLALFELFGEESPLTQEYRQEMASVLF